MENNYGVSVGKLPMGAVGVTVDGAMTAKEAIDKAGLNWTVSKRPVLFQSGYEGQVGRILKEMPDKFVIARDDNDKGLGVLTDRYEILQNKTAFDFTDALAQEKLGTYEMAFSLKGGRRIVIMFKLPDTVMVLGKDPITGYVMFTTTHDGSGSVMGAYTPKRMFCLNQLNGIMEGASFKIRHTQTMHSKVDMARNALGIAKQNTQDMLDKAEAMARTKLTQSMIDEVMKGINLDKQDDESTKRLNTREHILTLQENGYGHGIPEIRNSLWTMYNAVTQHVDHKWSNVHTSKGFEGAQKSVESSMFGAGARLKTTALDVVLSLTK